MIGVKMNTFSDSSIEPEQDANSALTELDKGLRSGKVGEQCEAIVRFPRLFEKYPFPILINSSFLKLADVFRMGNNFLRLWVLRVCQQSEKHLDKILNVDEFLRRVFSVIHSNDPVARALTLKTLGAVAGIIPERQNVHHAIRRALDSHDEVEVDAAIYATTRFAAHSNAFAVAMCNKLSDMIECESTGAERRAKLVLALRTVHGGAVRAQGVLKLLHSLLERFPSASAVRAAIVALTAITVDTVVHVPDQVEVLLDIAGTEPRCSVRRAALVGLRRLAVHAALWTNSSLAAICTVAGGKDKLLCLHVMKRLVECPAVCATAQNGPIAQFCSEAALSSDLNMAATAAAVLTKIIVHCYEECLPVDGSNLMLALEGLVVNTGAEDSEANMKSLRVALSCLVQLSRRSEAAYAARTARLVRGQLRGCLRARVRRRLSLLEALAALAAHPAPARQPDLALPDLLLHLDHVIDGLTIVNNENEATSVVLICTIIFQDRAAKSLTMKIDNVWESRIMDAMKKLDGWTRYRVAKAALRYGHHSVAAQILSRLAEAAESESTQRWLSTLCLAATADKQLAEEGIRGLGQAASQWQVASSMCGGGTGGAGAASCAPTCAGCAACSVVCAAWLGARAGALHALDRAAAAARVLCTQPPPAIAQSARECMSAAGGAGSAGGAGGAGGALVRAGGALLAAAGRFAHIATTAFHADDATLTSLHISQHIYTQFAHFLFRITNSQEPPADLTLKELEPRTLEEVIALAPSVEMTKIANKLFNDPTTGQGLTHRHAEAVVCMVAACSVGALWGRGAAAGRGGGPLCRVALAPGPRGPAADHAAALPLTHRLALKLEGVILPPLPLSKRQQQRKVKSVQITVTAIPHPRTSEKTVELTNIPPVLTAVQVVTPVKDFFSAQQLISVNNPGLYTVAVESAFIDEKGQLWNTGPKSSIVIKAHEDPNSKGNSQAARGRF